MALHVAVLGASGNVGRQVVRGLLCSDDGVIARVDAINRRVIDDETFPADEPRLVKHVVDMSSGEALAEACARILADTDVVVATMGIGSGKGSLDEFRTAEVELPTAFARAAVAAGVRRAVLLTGVGADIESTNSWLALGTAEGQLFHLKGLVEKNFTDAGFTDGLTVFRPGGLLGTPHIPGWAEWLMPKLDWMAPARFRSIHVDKLAHAMARAAVETTNMENDVEILEGKSLFEALPGSRTLAGF